MLPAHVRTLNYNVSIERGMKLRFLTVALLAVTTALAQNGKHPFTFEDMMKLKRVGAPVPSPDGKWVVFDCVDVDLGAGTRISHLRIVPASGGDSRRLSKTANHENDRVFRRMASNSSGRRRRPINPDLDE